MNLREHFTYTLSDYGSSGLKWFWIATSKKQNNSDVCN